MRHTLPRATDASRFCSLGSDDGRPLLRFVAVGLILAGGFALFLTITGNFLPHDEAYLGMTQEQLCAVYGCRVVGFMFHNRASFGGALIAVGIINLWLIEFPLRQGERWAWRAVLLNCAIGFASFFLYLSYGYLDTWHASASVALFVAFAIGMMKTNGSLRPCIPRERATLTWNAGRILFIMVASGLMVSGLIIMTVGATSVFVPQDLTYMCADALDLAAFNPKLIALIAHDRAGFGGALVSSGTALLLCMLHAPLSRSLWQALVLMGTVGFGCTIAVHIGVGYVDPIHLGPAIAGAGVFAAACLLSFTQCHVNRSSSIH